MFVYEKIDDKGKEYLKQFNFLFDDKEIDVYTQLYSWSIDRETGYVLVPVEAGAFERPMKFYFIYKGISIRIYAYREVYSKINQEGKKIITVNFEIEEISGITSDIKADKDIIVQNIFKALIAYDKTRPIQGKADKVNVTLLREPYISGV